MTFERRDHRVERDELECRETCWLQAHRVELVREQRRLHARELAVVAILDRRGALDPGVAAEDGVSSKTLRDTVEVARRLESLPAIAEAVAEGRISAEQLGPVVELADETTDAEWAERAPRMSPADLARQAREQRTPTAEESMARWRARCLKTWWNPDHTVLHLHGELPGHLGAKVEATLHEVMEENKPAKGEPWERHDARAADALGVLCDREHADEPPDASTGRTVRTHTPTAARKPVMSVHVPLVGPATIAGVPIPDELLEQLRANSTIELVLVDDHDVPLTIGRRHSAISPKIARAVRQRDGHCQCGTNCTIRHGLEIHHLIPRSWGGTDDIANLTAIFGGHHPDLIPHGPWALIGNPNIPGDLHRILYTDLTDEEAAAYGLPPPPRKPEA